VIHDEEHEGIARFDLISLRHAPLSASYSPTYPCRPARVIRG
jgi:hypothetical protein